MVSNDIMLSYSHRSSLRLFLVLLTDCLEHLYHILHLTFYNSTTLRANPCQIGHFRHIIIIIGINRV